MKSPMKIIQVYYTEEGKIPEETFPDQIQKDGNDPKLLRTGENHLTQRP